MNFVAIFRNYIALTKPTIVLTFALTGFAAMMVEGGLLKNPPRFFFVLLAITLTAASANAFNQYLERDLDAKMDRTRRKRPLPQSKMSPKRALIFSYVLGALAFFYLLFFINFLSAAFSLATILFYILIYTLWLKPRTPYNIVIGGAAGATAPLIAWAAGSNEISWLAWWMFSLIFIWTPPHFWALSLCVKDQYGKAGIPMLPVVKGDKRTLSEIWIYSLLLLFLSLLPMVVPTSFGYIYNVGALLLGLYLCYGAWKLKRGFNKKRGYQFFGYTIVYLIVLFILMAVDS